MTETEAALQAAIDANPLTGLRMILADHLDEIGDVRADGYRVLDLLGRWPTNWGVTEEGTDRVGYYVPDKTQLNDGREYWIDYRFGTKNGGGYRSFWLISGKNRRQADDEAARLWAELPEESRREVLAMVKAN